MRRTTLESRYPKLEGSGRRPAGMKAHVGVDSQSKLIHSAAVTLANTPDSQVLEELLHGGETRVWGSAYSDRKKALSRCAPKARDDTRKKGAGHASYRVGKGGGIGTSQKRGAKRRMCFL